MVTVTSVVLACNYGFDYWGKGTQVTVTSATQETPSVFPLLSCCDSSIREQKGSVTFGCLLAGSSTRTSKIIWQPDEPGKKEFPEAQEQGNRWFSTSRLTVPFSTFQTTPYTCTVQQSNGGAQNDGLLATIDSKQCNWAPPKPVQVQILTPDCDAQATDSILKLVCVLQSLGPGKASVEWLKNGQAEPEKVEVTLATGKDKSGGYFSFVQRNINKDSWDKGDLYTCKVTRSLNVTTQNTSKCQACYSSMRQRAVFITKPSYRELLERTATVTCTVVGPSLKNTQITWQVDGRPSTGGQKSTVKTDANGNQNVIAIHPVSLEQWKKGTKIACKVAGDCYEEDTKEVTIQKDPRSTKPSIAISRANLAPSPKSPMALILLCDVSGFSPMEISISWKKDNIPLNEKLFENGNATPAGDVYSTYSILKIGRDEPRPKAGSYSCVVHHSSSEEPITASEDVPIDPFESKAPTVELLQSVDRKKKTMMLKCIASNYRPRSVTIQWNGGSQNKNEVFTEEKMVDGTYRASGLFVIPLAQWQEAEHSCVVVHKETNSREVKTISRKDLRKNSSITLLCSIYGYSLENIKVIWNGGGKTQKVQKQDTQRNGDQFYTTSNLSVPLQEWNKLHEYSCEVTQPGTNNTQISKISKCTACKDSIPKPSLYLVKPPLKGLLLQRTAVLTCLVVGYQLDHAKLTWMVNDLNRTKDAKTLNIVTHENQTQSLQSQLNITGQDWDSGSEVQCVISHSCSFFPKLKQSIKTNKDSKHIKAPSLSLVIPSPTQLMQPTIQAVAWLACEISGFSPAEILVSWKKDNSSIASSEYITGPPIADAGSYTFTTQSILKVPASEWESRALYTCEVGHESLTVMENISRKLNGMVPSLNNKTAIDMQSPPFEELFLNKSAALTCKMPLVNANALSTVSWTMDGEPANVNAVTTTRLSENDSIPWIYSQLWVNLTEWKASAKFTCSILSNQGEIKADFDRRNGTMKLPKVHLQRQSSNEDQNVTLVCVARDFYPEEIFLKWEEANEEISAKSYEAHDLNCDHESQRCSLVSILEVPISKWMMGVSYTCLVAHISSENIITRRTSSFSDSWDCAVMGFALCDIRNEKEYEYSELEDANGVWNKVSTFMVLFVVALFYGGLVTFIKVKRGGRRKPNPGSTTQVWKTPAFWLLTRHFIPSVPFVICPSTE
ncbi:uncharacterized protein LOC134405985 [Elgaria multicarinata webbii]|uniref:uncharacterized protein LOC134405985 n=1 Tax=Elgaria multicarinata webbii TaxID=159646 RepID=UPI002FCD2980